MDPIISPAFFYLINVSEQIWWISVLLFTVSFTIFLIAVITFYFNFSLDGKWWEDVKRSQKIQYALVAKKCAVISAVVAVVNLLFVIFVPRKNTVIEMMIASGVTRDNLSLGVGAVKEIVDYVVEAIGRLK